MWFLLACGPGVLEADPGADAPVVPDPTEDTDTSPPVDFDGDGYGPDVDCDDANFLVHPGAEEVCDPLDVDENCDGLADEEDPSLQCGEDVVLPFAARAEIVDVAVLVDTTASMAGMPDEVATAMQEAYVGLVAAGLFPTWGAAAARDYGLPPFGLADDTPFALVHGQSADVERVAGALRLAAVGGGGDAPDAGHEAIYQAIAGLGYDQDCDGVEDSVDVRPFLPSADDAFGGTAPGSFDPSGAVAGLVPGMGWVENSLRVVLYVTDAPLRDPDDGDDAPGGCTQDAGSDDVITAALAHQARVAGAVVGGSPDGPAWTALEALAAATGALRPDGTPAVSNWDASGDTLAADLVDVIESAALGDVEVVVSADNGHHVVDYTPTSFAGVTLGDDLAVTVTVDGIVATSAADGAEVVFVELRSSLGFTLVRHALYVE